MRAFNSGIPEMSDQYFYLRFRFSAKSRGHSFATARWYEAFVEVPKDLVLARQAELINENPKERAITLDLARRTAFALFSAGAGKMTGPYNEDALWCDDRPAIMNLRPCDHEENGIRAWKLA
jgi:hypothetical protein